MVHGNDEVQCTTLSVVIETAKSPEPYDKQHADTLMCLLPQRTISITGVPSAPSPGLPGFPPSHGWSPTLSALPPSFLLLFPPSPTPSPPRSSWSPWVSLLPILSPPPSSFVSSPLPPPQSLASLHPTVDLRRCLQVFRWMANQRCFSGAASLPLYHALLRLAGRQGKVNRARELFSDMLSRRWEPPTGREGTRGWRVEVHSMH